MPTPANMRPMPRALGFFALLQYPLRSAHRSRRPMHIPRYAICSPNDTSLSADLVHSPGIDARTPSPTQYSRGAGSSSIGSLPGSCDASLSDSRSDSELGLGDSTARLLRGRELDVRVSTHRIAFMESPRRHLFRFERAGSIRAALALHAQARTIEVERKALAAESGSLVVAAAAASWPHRP